MKITRIKTSNFRQHKAIEIDLSSEQSDFVVIKGNMGSGKTNLLNAVTWALYGEVDDAIGKQTQLLNDSVLLELSEGDYADVEVNIDLKLDNDQAAYVSRKQTFKKSSGSAVNYGDPTITVQVVKNVANGFEVEPNPLSWIEKIFRRDSSPTFYLTARNSKDFSKNQTRRELGRLFKRSRELTPFFN